jgi:hypothetical protein
MLHILELLHVFERGWDTADTCAGTGGHDFVSGRADG